DPYLAADRVQCAEEGLRQGCGQDDDARGGPNVGRQHVMACDHPTPCKLRPAGVARGDRDRCDALPLEGELFIQVEADVCGTDRWEPLDRACFLDRDRRVVPPRRTTAVTHDAHGIEVE